MTSHHGCRSPVVGHTRCHSPNTIAARRIAAGVDESLGDACHGIAEADDLAAQQIDDGEQQCDHGAPWQSDIGIGVCECIDEAGSIPESADIDQADNGEYDEDDDEALDVYTAAEIWASNGKDEDYMFGYSEDELEAAL